MVSLNEPETIMIYQRTWECPIPKVFTFMYVLTEIEWFGCGVRTVKVAHIKVDKENGAESWLITYTMRYKPEGWDACVQERA